MSRIKVLCIGNSLVADDAFGPQIYDHFCTQKLPANVSFRMMGVGGLDLLSEFDGEDLVVVVDAVNMGKTPGSLSVLPWQQIASAAGTPVTSHDIGIDEVMKIGQLLHPEQMPNRLVFVGVEGRDFKNVGAPLSPEVQAVFHTAVHEIKQLIGMTF